MIEHMQNVVAFGMPGGWEWIIILVVAVLLFGRRLPEIARGMGKSITEFKKGIKEAQEEVTKTVDEDVVSPAPEESSSSADDSSDSNSDSDSDSDPDDED